MTTQKHNPYNCRAHAVDVGNLENVVFDEGFLIPLEGTPEQKAIVSRQPVLFSSVAELAKFGSPWVRYAIEHEVKSGCILPLITYGRAFGALGVVSLREGHLPKTT